ncbi:ROK family protein [Trichloromonas sp.]|uniref:ROK family protein n=1 Tax=Trichloromonas sp. TaxID=3069249 RepID=UPI002A49BA0E|nr:ROK family protein [Trichloromonas sp.]
MTPAVIGIDLGGTNCRAALVGTGGRIGEIRRRPTEMVRGYDAWLAELVAGLEELLRQGEGLGLKVAAVGMGAPGLISGDGTVVASPNLPHLDGRPLAVDLAARLKRPVTVANDANASAWGEALFGAGREFNSFLAVTLGTGVGGGLVLNRRLWLGADGAAGEVGHWTVVPGGRLCGCGNRGCLEQYASARALAVSARERIAAGEASALAAIPAAELTSRQVGEAARRGDALALGVLEEAGGYLGQVLGGVANLLNLDGAVIAGGAVESFDLMQPAILRALRQHAFPVSGRRMSVVPGRLGDEAGILGAAALAGLSEQF